MPYCAKCGKELAEDAKFCPSCGTPTPLASEEETKRARMGRPEWWE